MNKDTIDGSLLFAQNALHQAANNPAISAALADFGFDATRIAEGSALLSAAQTLVTDQRREYGEQFAATDAMSAAQAEANGTYIRQLKIARIALRGNRGAAESMMLGGDRLRTFSGWLKQANAFYVNALSTPAVVAAMSQYGITQERLEAGQAQVQVAEQRLNEQLREKGEAQQATLDRDNALEALNAYVGDLVKICRIALEGQPQYLEMLGIAVHNE